MELIRGIFARFEETPDESVRHLQKKREYQRESRTNKKARDLLADAGNDEALLQRRAKRLESQRERQRRYMALNRDALFAERRKRRRRRRETDRDGQCFDNDGDIDKHKCAGRERQKNYFEVLFRNVLVNTPTSGNEPESPSRKPAFEITEEFNIKDELDGGIECSAPGVKDRNCAAEPETTHVNINITKQTTSNVEETGPKETMQKSTWYTSCSYADCRNSRSRNPTLSFHKFPTGDPDRCEKWIRNSGNQALTELATNQLQARLICETHFPPGSFRDMRDPKATKKYLLWNAVPNQHPTAADVIMPPKKVSQSVAVDETPIISMGRPVRAASKEAIKQLQMLSQSEDDEPETLEILSDDDEVIPVEPVPVKKKYQVCHRRSSDGNERDILVLKTLTAGEPSLTLQSWIEELSPIQLELQNRSKKEYKEMTEKIDTVLTQAGAEVIFEGHSFSAFHMEGPPTTTTAKASKYSSMSASTSDSMKVLPVIKPSPVVTKPSPVAPKSAVTSKQTPVVANIVNSAVASSQSNVGTGYSLVVDPRSGQVVGTVTPATQSLLKTTLNSPVTRKRGRSSIAAPVTTPPTKLTKIGTQAVIPPPLVSLRPTEANSIGGLQSNGNSPARIPSAVVDLTADDGKSSADSKEVSFNKLQGKTFPSLVVVARPSLKVPLTTPAADRAKLDAKVKSVLMHPPTKFTEWLIQQGLVRSEQNCSTHTMNKLKLGMYSDVAKFPFSGGYVWISECCPHKFVSVFAGSIFESSPHPPSIILKLIYHWSCQTNVQNVTQWVKVENLYVKGLNTWLRAICTVALHTHIPQLGGPGIKVEIGVISLGTTSQDGHQRQVKVEVLGILETQSKKIRLRAVEPLSDDDRNYKKRFSKILEPLTPWVHPGSIIVTDLTVDKNTLHSMGFLNIQQSSSGGGNNMIMDYLRRIVPRMFQNTLSLLSRQIIQQFLDELVWREWFGTKPSDAFDNMILHLTQQTRTENGQALIVRLNKIATNPFKNWSPTVTAQQPPVTKQHVVLELPKRQRRKPAIIRSASPVVPELLKPAKQQMVPDVPDEIVPLEHYYYGTINGVNELDNVPFNVKCHICKVPFTNNIEMMKHYYVHAHNNSVDYQCHYCLAGVSSKAMLEVHISQKHPMETKCGSEFVCVICECRFSTSYLLGKHMSLLHVPSELPYQCDSCTFRCSSHRQAVDHFHSVHKDQGVLQCPFCLKTTTVVRMGRSMPQHVHYYLNHLQKHQRKSLAKKCSKCQLWFIQKDGVKDHLHMHETQRRKAGLKPWDIVSQGITVPKSISDFLVDDEDIDISNLEFDLPENPSNCKECNKELNVTHYESLLTCTNENCQYVTCCKEAMELHIETCKNFNQTLPVMQLPSEMFCVCGHSDKDGNLLAKHLAVCERNSAYPSLEAAKDATITHSMLDVLGLVRRLEEAPTQVDSSSDTEGHKKADTGKVSGKRKKPGSNTPNVIDLEEDMDIDDPDPVPIDAEVKKVYTNRSMARKKSVIDNADDRPGSAVESDDEITNTSKKLKRSKDYVDNASNEQPDSVGAIDDDVPTNKVEANKNRQSSIDDIKVNADEETMDSVETDDKGADKVVETGEEEVNKIVENKEENTSKTSEVIEDLETETSKLSDIQNSESPSAVVETPEAEETERGKNPGSPTDVTNEAAFAKTDNNNTNKDKATVSDTVENEGSFDDSIGKVQSSESKIMPVLFNETESPLLPVMLDEDKECVEEPPSLDSENLEQMFSDSQDKMNDQILENDMDGLLNNIMDSAECPTGNDISEIIAN